MGLDYGVIRTGLLGALGQAGGLQDGSAGWGEPHPGGPPFWDAGPPTVFAVLHAAGRTQGLPLG